MYGSERGGIMSNQNEIDDILNEIKNRRREESKQKEDTNADSFSVKEEKAVQQDDLDIKLEIKSDTEKEVSEKEEKEFSVISNNNVTDSTTENESVQESEDIMGNKRTGKKKSKNNKKTLIIIIAVIAVIVIAGVIFAVVKNSQKEPETTANTTTTTQAVTQAPVVITNPLTGESGFNESAVNKRPVAVVVENASAARPQWGINDGDNSPDIILEGEVEGGETRMLWFYADYTSIPSQIGPVRSARPPFIRFSQLFDSIFVHWGMSTSKGDYVGADSVFASEDIDHINQMAYSDKVGLFGRDKSRGVSSEHTGVLYGANMAAAIEGEEFRTDVDSDSFTAFTFNDNEEKMGDTACNSIGITFSSRSKTRDWSYSADDKMYHSTDYQTDVARKNILVLYDNTSYIVKSNYKGSGSNEVYCNYELSGGSGKLASMGTVCDIKWSVEDGKLSITDENGNAVSLNAGTTWIGWASDNNGGSVTVA